MNTPHQTLFTRFRRVALALVVACGAIVVQPIVSGQDIGSLYDGAVADMREKKWDEALKALQEIVDRFGESAKEDFGSKFGVIYFNKGICEFELREFEKAATSFKAAYEDFPNEGEYAGQNPYQKVAMFRWAAAEQYQGNYKEALDLFLKFRDLKPEPGSFSESAWYLAVGICSAELGRLEDAERYIGKVFTDSKQLGASLRQLFTGFKTLAEKWIGEGPKASPQAIKFIDTHGGRLRADPWEIASSKIDAQMLKLGSDAVDAGMVGFALRLLAYVPKTSDVVQDLERRAANYAVVPQKLTDEIVKYRSIIDKGDPIELRALSKLAVALDKLGNKRGGYVIYEFLATNYEKSQFRPQILFGATSMAAQIMDYPAVQFFGLTFLEEFPDHELKDEVASLMLGQLFQNGEYERALELARDLRRELPEKSPDRDLPDFVVGGSLFFLGEFSEAQPELDAHAANFPESKFREQSLYYQAANLVKLLRWDDAAAKLDAFIEKFPKSSLLDLAYLDRANCHFAKEEGGKALELVARIKKEYPDSVIMDSALLLEGDVHYSRGALEEAEAAYVQSRDLAAGFGHDEVKANALSQLVGVEVSREAFDKALVFYDEFAQDHEGSYFEPVTVVTAMPALEKANRADEGLDKLERMIVELGQDPDSPDLEKAVNTYSMFFQKLRDPEALVARLREFPGVPADNVPLRAWLTMARIDVLEDPANKDKFDRREAQVEVAYSDLRELPKGQLANYILMKVGRNLIDKGQPEEAVSWFTTVIDGNKPEFKDFATLGLAQVYAKSIDPAQRASAVQLFKRVIAEFRTPELQEQAYLGIGRLHFDDKKYRAAIDEGFLPYVNNKTWQSARAEANFKLGRSYEELGEIDNALLAYLGTYVNYRGQIAYSAEAWFRAAELRYNAGKKQEAFDMINEMVTYLGRFQGNELDKGDYIRQATLARDRWAGELGIVLEQNTN